MNASRRGPAGADIRSQQQGRLADSIRILQFGMAPVLLALTIGISGDASAEVVGVPALPPFSSADADIIARNKTLREAATDHPWLVFRILREIGDNGLRTGLRPKMPATIESTKPDEFDPGNDPDLSDLQRTAPEAAHDLFVLIKKASQGGKPR